MLPAKETRKEEEDVEFQALRQQRSDERADTQKKSFARWINQQLQKGGKDYEITDLVEGLKDGTILLSLMEVLTGERLRRERGKMRLHMLNNVNKVIHTLEEYHVKLVNICSDDIVDGNVKLILGLIWSIILQFQVKSVMSHVVSDLKQTDIERTLLSWCKQSTRRYRGAKVTNFTTSWRDGIGFNALIHFHRNEMFDFNILRAMSPRERLKHAFKMAKDHLGIVELLDPEDIDVDRPDKKSILMYLTMLFEVLPNHKEIVIEEMSESSESELQITEVYSPFNLTDHGRGGSPTPSSISNMSEWEDYNETLNQILSWLLQAETQLKNQSFISNDVDSVKGQFKEHEEFMIVLTSHQSSVGSVLEFGSQLINEGMVSGKEEQDIRDQMSVLSERWETLRVAAMDRQAKLHQALMQLQQGQLEDLAKWLDLAEDRMESSGMIGSDLEVIEKQVDDHKKFQEDIENQQKHVNSLSHMVVVVDESNDESVTADLEQQLANLGERWSAVCRWTEKRWILLQEVLSCWRLYRGEETRLNSWLHEKETSLADMGLVDLGDKGEIAGQLQKLKLLEQELTAQQSTFGDFNLAAQRVAQNLDEESPAIESIQDTMEEFNQRWNSIASQLNSKMRMLKAMESKLESFLVEVEDNMAWMKDTELLLSSQGSTDDSNKQEELVESLDSAMKKRRISMTTISKRGDELINTSKNNGQSTVGLEQCLTTFTEKWDSLCNLIENKKKRVELIHQHLKFQSEAGRILLTVTEIETWITSVSIDYKEDPKKQLDVIKTKTVELSTYKAALDKMKQHVGDIDDPKIRLSFESELHNVREKFRIVCETLESKQHDIIVMIKSVPPPEFQERYSHAKTIIEEANVDLKADFTYNSLEVMDSRLLMCNETNKGLKPADEEITFLENSSKDIFHNMSTDGAKRSKTQLADLRKELTQTAKSLVTREQRLKEAIQQVKEIDVAMAEIFVWMSDVEKFLSESASAIAEGDPVTVQSQLDEVEDLHGDISAVQKKVDALIETCTYIMNHAQGTFAEEILDKLNRLNNSWEKIFESAKQEKRNLKKALDRLKEADNLVKTTLTYLQGVEDGIDNENLDEADEAHLKARLKHYQSMNNALTEKLPIIQVFNKNVTEILSSPNGSLPEENQPALKKDLDALNESFPLTQKRVKITIDHITRALTTLRKFSDVVVQVKTSLRTLEDCINTSSEALDAHQDEIESCLALISNNCKAIQSPSVSEMNACSADLTKIAVGSVPVAKIVKDLSGRISDSINRTEKVKSILEGELMKRQQLSRDMISLEQWLKKTESDLKRRGLSGKDDKRYNETLTEELSLNEALLMSAEKSIKDLTDAGASGVHDEVANQLKSVQQHWLIIKKLFNQLKQQPRKDLEVKFSSLEGSILSDIDVIKRKCRKLNVSSSNPHDVESTKDSLKYERLEYDRIAENIEELNNLGASICEKSNSRDGQGIQRSVAGVKKEYATLKQTIDDKESQLNNLSQLSDSTVMKDLQKLEAWVRVTELQLSKVTAVRFPADAENVIIDVKSISIDLSHRGSDIEKLRKSVIEYISTSETNSSTMLENMEERTSSIYQSWLRLSKQTTERQEELRSWVQLLDSHENAVDDVNTWLDSISHRLDDIEVNSSSKISKLSAVENEFQSCDKRLKDLHSISTEIEKEGQLPLVEPYKSRLVDRIDEIGMRIRNLKKATAVDDEAMITASVVQSVHSAPDQIKVVVEEEAISTMPTRNVESHAETDVLNQSSDDYGNTDIASRCDRMLSDLKTLQSRIVRSKVKLNNSGSIARVHHETRDIVDDFNKLNLKTDELIDEGNQQTTRDDSLAKKLKDLQEKRKQIKSKLSVRNSLLIGIEQKFYHFENSVASIKEWISDQERVMKSTSRKTVPVNDFEMKVAEMEAINVKVEQLSDVYSMNIINKEEIADLNLRFKVIYTSLESLQKSEDKLTNYRISVYTGDMRDGDTCANVYVRLYGEYGCTEDLYLRQSETRRKKFQPGQVDVFNFNKEQYLGKLIKLKIWHDNTGESPAWFLSSIYVLDELSGRLYCYSIDTWLRKESGSNVEHSVPVNGMSLYRDSAPDVLTRPHAIKDVFWIFETFSKRNDYIEKYLKEICDASSKVASIETALEDPLFGGENYENFDKKQKKLKEIEDTMDKTLPIVDNMMVLRERYLSDCTAHDRPRIEQALNSLQSNWNAVTHEFKLKWTDQARLSRVWLAFQNEIKEFTIWLTTTENLLAATKLPTGEIDETLAKQEQGELEDSLTMSDSKLMSLSVNSHAILAQSSEDDRLSLQDKLAMINRRWSVVQAEILSRQRRFASANQDAGTFFEDCNDVLNWLSEVESLLNRQGPHPIDEDALEEHLDRLKTFNREMTNKREVMNNAQNSSRRLLALESDTNDGLRQPIKQKEDLVSMRWQVITPRFRDCLSSTENKLERATKFLEELEELYVWMSATRDLLEGQETNQDGVSVDPETMKTALETRKANVDAINRLLKELKADGELTSTFPKDVRDKIEKLNTDWQVIIQLAMRLQKQGPVDEDAIVIETVRQEESAMDFNFDMESYPTSSAAIDSSSTSDFDKSLAGLHDWLRLMEQNVKRGNTMSLGDGTDATTAVEDQKKLLSDFDAKRSALEDVIEAAAALSMETESEEGKYVIDDRVSKLKEHWEVIEMKVQNQITTLDKLSRDLRAFTDCYIPLDAWMLTANARLDTSLGNEIGSTVADLEDQLHQHEKFQQEFISWQMRYMEAKQRGDVVVQAYPTFATENLQDLLSNLTERWSKLQIRSASRQQNLQDALDRLLSFHKNMIAALTWLSSAESKVAELDSLVEASQTDAEQSDIDELNKELTELECDVTAHTDMFTNLNKIGGHIMSDLEPGEVLTALQSKLDDMNDRWNSLGLRVVDIRDRLSNGTGEWRQLLADMQDIIDWLIRADQELSSQQPIGGEIDTVQQQNENHQAFKGKLNVRQVVIEQALQRGHTFLTKHNKSNNNKNDRSILLSGHSNDDDQKANNLVSRVADNLHKQLLHVENQWKTLQDKSEEWQKVIDAVLNLLHQLLNHMDTLRHRLSESETTKARWPKYDEVPSDQLQSHMNEVKTYQDGLSAMEPLFDDMDGCAKQLRHSHNVSMSNQLEANIDSLHKRWKKLDVICSDIQRQIRQMMSEQNVNGSGVLSGSVSPSWERALAVNKVPYYINHETKVTQWDHPKMTELYDTLAELNDVKYSAYRTAMKLRCIQKACCLDMVSVNAISGSFDQHHRDIDNDSLIDVREMVSVLLTAFECVEYSKRELINIPQSVDLTLNWLLNVFDSGRVGKVRVLSFKVGLTLLSKGKLEEKWRYVFKQVADSTGSSDQKRLGLLLHDCVQIPRQLGEIAAFGGSNIEPSVRSCFEQSKADRCVSAQQFLTWMAHEPQSLVWMPVLHRLSAAETAKHDAKCSICKESPIVGFRYRCLKCFNYDLCQNCFWSGRVSKNHRLTHPVHQYSFATTTGEDLSDFVKLVRNKFKSRRYRNRPSKKLGYLPVQTVMEGGAMETPSVPSTPNTITFNGSRDFDSLDGSPSKIHQSDMEEEHRLIQMLCQNLSGSSVLSPKSPTQILAALETEHQSDNEESLRELENENKQLKDEYDRLMTARSQFPEGDIRSDSADVARDAELLVEAKNLRQHKGRLETRMQILEDHNRQLEAQLQRLRLLLEQPSPDRSRSDSANNMSSNASFDVQSSPPPAYQSPATLRAADARRQADSSHISYNGHSNNDDNDTTPTYQLDDVMTQIERSFPATAK